MTDESTTPAPAAPASPPDQEGLIATIRHEISEALGTLFDGGEATVAEGGGTTAPPAEKPLTAADVQRLAREEMARAQAELRSKSQAKKAAPAPASAAPAAAAPTTPAPEEPPKVRGAWEKVRHALWGDKD
ncbi:MAG: hypothetical protein M0Z46_19975 [Actinomycetota bacterium]|nr:hypothetical protein [Actinomycetota bacterium]